VRVRGLLLTTRLTSSPSLNSIVMSSPQRVSSNTTSPSTATSPPNDYFSQPRSSNSKPTSPQKTDQATASLAKVLAERSEILPQTMFGGLVDASSNLKPDPKGKQKLTWIKVEPGSK
jgi:hypothetical protein